VPQHVPVLLDEVRALLQPERGGLFVDCTVGLGGHARMLLEGGATRLIGIDRDRDAIAIARETLAPFADRVTLVHADYRAIAAVLDAQGAGGVDGVLADFGVSSMQLDAEGRGFSFRRDEPLDMRMDRTTGETAADLIDRVDQEELADVIYQFG
jgi:16S rRNA (cytosine1402-N4)-methyltransferase